jgi:ferredoxin
MDEYRRVAVLLCADLAKRDQDVSRLAWAAMEAGAASTHVIEGMCEHPRLIVDAAKGASRLVLVECGQTARSQEVQAWARRAGVDPFAVVHLPLPPALSEEGPRLVASAVARAAGIRGTSPRNMRVVLPAEAVSRRALFSLRFATYEPVAAVDVDRCVGTARCGACVRVCPTDAISPVGATPIVDDSSCIACGACVVGCPTTAITLPTAPIEGIEAQIAALASDSLAVLFACARLAGTLDDLRGPLPGWGVVELPCMALLTPGWILQTLAAGAPSVAVLGCVDECRAGGAANPVGERIGFCHDILTAVDQDDVPERVRLVPGRADELAGVLSAQLPASIARGDGIALREPYATADAVTRLLGEREASGLVQSDASPLGIVEVDVATCTVCGSCAAACPTGALRMEQGDGTVSLALESADCTGCGTCVSICPEHAVRVTKGADLARLVAGPMLIKEERILACIRCGNPVAPASMLRKIRELLPDGSPELLTMLETLCLNCRGDSLTPAVPIPFESDAIEIEEGAGDGLDR